MGGRISDITAVRQGERLTIYIGSASGGVWRSRDGGTTFKPIFDKEPSLSIGSVAIDPSDPKTVWVGTGESWVRNSVSVGTGIYRSHDEGDNWDSMGLKDSEHISRILIDPKNGNTVYACALGHLWNSNTERGVYKTTDGGKTWNKILYRNDSTGCADMAMDPQDPGIIYAAMWDVRREPWNFRSGGPGSGLFKSTDAGATWHELRKGLPEGDLGRIGVAVATSNPKRMYAVVEARNHTALFRSEDAGDSWTEVNNSFNISGRPFYFARIIIDPKDPDRVYKPGFFFTVSEDGGKSFSSAIDTQGPDDRRARRLPHSLDQSQQSRPDACRYRWRRLPVARSGNALAFPEQHSSRAVLSRQRRHGRSLQRLRRPPGQWHLDGSVTRRRWHPQPRVACNRHRRRLLGIFRSRPTPTTPTPNTRAEKSRASAKAPVSQETSSLFRAPMNPTSASTGTRPSLSVRIKKAQSISADNSSSARAITANPGSASLPT